MALKAVVYILVAAVFLLFLTFPRIPHSSDAHVHSRRMAFHHHAAFDPLVGKIERKIGERGFPDEPNLHKDLDSLLGSLNSSKFSGELDDLEEYFDGEGRFNITERLTYLFPLLDKWPNDGVISFQELEIWNKKQALDQLTFTTEQQMNSLDRNGDGSVTLQEYLFRLSDEEIESNMNNMEHGQVGWWKEQFDNADIDGNGSLNITKLKDFLHPQDSSNAKIQMWLLKARIREMDSDQDGKLSFAEFRDRTYDMYRNYAEFDSHMDDQNPVLNPEEKFQELDVNKDKFLVAEELMPIIHHVNPGELSYASYYTTYLMREADDNRDGNLTLKEMLDHEHSFYNTVVKDGSFDDDHNTDDDGSVDDDDDDDDDDYGDEFLRDEFR